MKHLPIGLAALLAASTGFAAAPVAFEATVTAYENERFEAARTSFQRMAEAGLPEAQFNLGVMTLNGQGGPADRVEAALWVRLAADAEYEPAVEAVDVLMEHLDDGQNEQFEQRLPDWRENHALGELIERHRPEACQSDCLEPGEGPHGPSSMPEASDSTQPDNVVRTVDGKPLTGERSPPRYPRRAAEQNLMGRVVLGGWIGEDGRLQHPHVIESFPDEVFDDAAMQAWTSWEFEWPEGAPASVPQYVSQNIVFRLDELKSGGTQREFASAVEEGEEELQAAHKAVWMVERLELPVSEKARPDSVVSIISRAAEAGVIRAQRDLADRQARGDMVRQDRDGAIFWLKQAAFEGDALAQFELARWERLDDGFRSDLRRAAARQGLLPAVVWELRERVARAPGQVDRDYLQQLLERLPNDWQHGEELVERARRLADS